MIDGRNVFDQPAKSDIRIYCNIQKVKEIITQLIVGSIIIISISTIK